MTGSASPTTSSIPGVFIRSMANRGALGGLSEAALQAALLMDAAGRDVVLLETVGVGQAEVDIIDHADTVVLVLMPGSGDSIQALKAGVMEIPDVIVVNKADHPMTDTMVREIKGVLALGPREGWEVPVIRARRRTGSVSRRFGRSSPSTAPTSRPRARSQRAAAATCAARCWRSRPIDCDASWRRRSRTTPGFRRCSTGSSRERLIRPVLPRSCSRAGTLLVLTLNLRRPRLVELASVTDEAQQQLHLFGRVVAIEPLTGQSRAGRRSGQVSGRLGQLHQHAPAVPLVAHPTRVPGRLEAVDRGRHRAAGETGL